MWLSVWVASNLSLLINTAVVKVFLHQDFYGSGALTFSLHMCIPSFGQARLSLCHLIHISEFPSMSFNGVLQAFGWDDVSLYGVSLYSVGSAASLCCPLDANHVPQLFMTTQSLQWSEKPKFG